MTHPRSGCCRLPQGAPPRRGAGSAVAHELLTMTATQHAPRPVEVALLASVFVVAACGLVYELAAGALASYVLGDSVLQFSTVIGTYLFAMGVGSWLSRFFERQLPAHFLRIELMVALVGGAMPALLFMANAYVPDGLPGPALRPRARGGHAGRPGDPAGDAHPQAQRRAQGAGLAGPHLRLPGCAGGFARVSAAAGAAAGADPHRPAVRPDERGRRPLGALAVPPRAAAAARPCGRLLRDPGGAGRGIRRRAGHHVPGRGQVLPGPDRVRGHVPLPAHRGDPGPRRASPVPQRQPAVRRARRVPLPRGAGAPGDGGARRGPQGRGAGRRRRHGGARSAAPSRRGKRHPGRARPEHDAAVLHARDAGAAQRRRTVVAQAEDRERRRVPVAAADPRDVRRDRGGLPRSHQLFHRQALHQLLLRADGAAPRGQRLRGGADHFPAGRAPEFLDRGGHARIGGPEDRALPRACAQLRRMGLRDRRPPAVPPAHRTAGGPEIPHDCAACRRCSTSRATWRACRPK